MRGRTRPAAVLVTLLLAISLCGGTATGFAASTVPCPGCLLAGAATVDITFPVGVPLAGYGGLGRRLLVPDILDRYPYVFWLKPSTGVHLPIKVRGLVLERDEVRLLWVALDVVGLDPELVRRLKTRLAEAGRRYSAVIVTASHTHSGPGGYSRSGLFGFLALDRYVPEIADRLVAGMVRAVEQAEAQKVPARVGGGSGEVSGLAKSRVKLPLDPEVGVLKVVATDGSPVALVWNYAIHGTTLGKKNLRLSGDVMGVAGERLERVLGVPALYTNGAVGDVSPALHGLAGAERLGEALAQAVLDVWRKAPVDGEPTLRAIIEPVRLPAPRLSLRNCLGRWLPRSLTLGLGRVLAEASEMVGVAVGSQAWVTVPGELQTRLGQEVKREGRRVFSSAFVVGLANDYRGYFLTRTEYHKVSYIACASLYGETAGEVIVERANAILRRLGGS
ncbi:MAG: neutral/alkaline non-lysosomal ceramidase N-terminal domain-containing protein [Candidatus Methylomirabilia bacterium]